MQGLTPVAIEVLNDPSLPEYSGDYILLARDDLYGQFIGFHFDEFGNYIQDIGVPNTPQAINDAENLFGFDLNNCLLYTSDAADD